MKTILKNTLLLNLVLGLLTLLFADVVGANPPTRVARLSFFSNAVSFAPAGAKRWVAPMLNRPVTAGDRLWSDKGGRAELQLGTSIARIGSETSLSVLNLNDKILQLKLDQGTLNLRIWSIAANQVYEINTPNLAFSIRKSGEYRFDVDKSGNVTTVSVRSGQGNAYGQNAVYAVVKSHQACRFTGTDLRGYQCALLAAPDAFEQWSLERDRRGRKGVSVRYVSPEVIGYEDLDAHGTWHYVSKHGYVWMPTRVAKGWAPYRFGHWSWIAPWGWTWIDNEPWGFAPFHYGRWIQLDGTWYWVPGRTRARPVYSPALVAFVGGDLRSPQSKSSLVAWFPLGPGEIYRPSYPVSRDYFVEVNTSSMGYNPYILRAYERPNLNIIYVNRLAPNAVSAVPTTVFVSSQPVSQATINISPQTVAKEPVKNVVPLAPTPVATPSKADQAAVKPPEAAILPGLAVIKTPPATEAAAAVAPAQLDKVAKPEAEKPAQLVPPAPPPVAVVPPPAPATEAKPVAPVAPPALPAKPVVEAPHPQIPPLEAAKPVVPPAVQETKPALEATPPVVKAPSEEVKPKLVQPTQEVPPHAVDKHPKADEKAAEKPPTVPHVEAAPPVVAQGEVEAAAAKAAVDARLQEERAAVERAAVERRARHEQNAIKEAQGRLQQEERAAERRAKQEQDAAKAAEGRLQQEERAAERRAKQEQNAAAAEGRLQQEERAAERRRAREEAAAARQPAEPEPRAREEREPPPPPAEERRAAEPERVEQPQEQQPVGE
jgi:hypothetical protein